MTDFKVAVVGAGKMGGAVLRAMVEKGGWPPASIGASDRDKGRLTQLQEELGIVAFQDNREACFWAEALVLAVKPQQASGVMEEISSSIRKDHLLVSVIMGKPLSFFKGFLPPDVPIVRAMPNTPALIGKGITAVSFDEGMGQRERERALSILSCLGEVVELDENLQDAAMAVSGCGPAYFFLVVEALMEGGIRLGLDADTALRLALHTMIGAGELLKVRGEHPAVLKEEVASPGGATIAALEALEEGGLRGAFFRALRSAWTRAKEV